jgi:hypothetical protein
MAITSPAKGRRHAWLGRRMIHANGCAITHPFPHCFAGCISESLAIETAKATSDQMDSFDRINLLAQTKIYSNFRST